MTALRARVGRDERLKALIGIVALAIAGFAGVASAATGGVVVLGATIGLTYLVVAYRNLAAGLALFTFLTFYDLAAAGLGGGVTFSKVGGGLLTLLWLLVISSRGSSVPLLVRDQKRFAVAVIGLIAWAVASTLWAGDFWIALSDSFRLAQGLVLIFVIYTAVQERQHVRWMVAAFVGGASLAALFGIVRSSGTRISGGFDDPNELAAVIVPGLALAAFAVAASRGRWSRWVYACVLPLLAIALIQTDSQGGLVALSVAALAAVVFGGPLRRQAAVAAALATLFAIGFYTFVTSPTGLTEGAAGREDLWKVALAVAGDHPVQGVGAGNFTLVEPRYALENIPLARVDLIVEPEVVHNSYLHMLAEYGGVGLGLFLLVIGASLMVALRAARQFARAGDRELELVARGLLVGACAQLAAYFFISAQYEKQLWLLVGLAAALHTVAFEPRSPARARPRDGRSSEAPRLR